MFPTVTGELYLGPDEGWVDVSKALRGRPARSGGGVTVTRGRPAEGQDVQTTQCEAVVNNVGGWASPRNPASPYFGLLGRNTPLRIRTAEADLGGALAVDGRRGAGSTAPGAAVTAPHTSLNGTGDVDVRVWLRLPQWTDHGGIFIAGKNDAWSIALGDTGSLEFRWITAAGSTPAAGSGSFKPVPAADGSLAVRATLTVATGLLVFYTAPTIAGPWTALSQGTFGATNVKASPTLGVQVGRVDSFGDHSVNGELYAMELRSGGALVASPDFTRLRAGDTQLVDAQGRVWTWVGGAVPIDRGARFHGEVWSWPQRWAPGGVDQWVPIQAAGITRRLSQGNSPVNSPLRRTLTAVNPAAYLPLEDGAEATRPAPATAASTNATSYQVTYGQEAGRLSGTSSAAKLTSATSAITSTVTPRPSSTTFWSALVFFKLAAMPTGAEQTYLRLYFAGGTVARWDFQLSAGGYRWTGYDKAGNVVQDQSFANTNQPPNDWLMMYVEWSVSGGNVTWQPWVANAGENVFSTLSWSYAGTLGYPTKVEVDGCPYFQDALVSHLAVDDQRLLTSADFAKVSTGYAGELAGARIARLAQEEGVPLTVWGFPHDTAALGPQPIAPLLDVLRDAAKVDGGILLEARGHLGLHYRTRASLYNQGSVALTYAQLSAPFEPDDDDDATRNDITVSRPGGASVRAVQTVGPLSTANPPDGVGAYDTSETVNVATEEQLPDQAYWRLHLGTVDESRYPRIGLNFIRPQIAQNPVLMRQLAAADAGDVASIANLPAWLPPGPAEVMVQGYTETLDAYEWTIVWNASPASPWDVAVVDGAAPVGADGTTLTASITAGTLSVQITSTAANKAWTTDPADFPIDLRVGAERVTATGITGTGLTQTVTLSARAVNGVARTWPAGTEVDVWQPAILSL